MIEGIKRPDNKWKSFFKYFGLALLLLSLVGIIVWHRQNNQKRNIANVSHQLNKNLNSASNNYMSRLTDTPPIRFIR